MLRALFNRASSNAVLILSLTTLFWAGNFVVGRGMHEVIPPFAMATLRWTLAFFLLLPFAYRHLARDWLVIRQNFPIIFLLGATGIGSFNSLAYIGLNHTTALNGLIMQSAGPVLIMIMALVLFGERISLRQVFGVIVSLAGVLVIISKAELSNLQALTINIGDFWVLAAMAVWAVYTVFLRKRPQLHPLSFIAATIFIGAVLNIPLFIWEHLTIRQMHITPASIATIAYISVFPSILSYLFYNKGVSLIGGSRAGMFLHLIPLFGTVLAIFFLGEQFFFYHGLGFVLILAGVTIAVRA